MGKLHFKDTKYDSERFLEELKISHFFYDTKIYKDFELFDQKVFKRPLEDMVDIEEVFPNIMELNSFSEMIEKSNPITINLWEEVSVKKEVVQGMEIEFDFNISPCYIQLFDLSKNELELMRKYLSTYDWRFNIVGLFTYNGKDYIYLFCDEEN